MHFENQQSLQGSPPVTATFQPTVIEQVDPELPGAEVQPPSSAAQSPPLSAPPNLPPLPTDSKLQSDYVYKFFAKYILPKLRGAGGHVDKAKLVEQGIFSDSFLLPCPRIHPKMEIDGVKICHLDEAWACAGAIVKVFDPALFDSCKGLKCECQLAKKRANPTAETSFLQSNGYATHARAERGFGATQRFFIVREYVCKNHVGTGPKTYNMFAPTLIAQLDDATRASIDFVVLSDKTLVSRATLNLIIASMEQGGNAFAKLADVSLRDRDGPQGVGAPV